MQRQKVIPLLACKWHILKPTLAFGVGASPDECQETDHYDFVASHQL